jgi:hypothetical protein
VRIDQDDHAGRIGSCRFAPGIRTEERAPRRQSVPRESLCARGRQSSRAESSARPNYRRGRLREIPGIGDAIADIIKKLHATGTHPAFEKMRKEIPGGVLEMLTIPGLRADKVLKLYEELGFLARGLSQRNKETFPCGPGQDNPSPDDPVLPPIDC